MKVYFPRDIGCNRDKYNKVRPPIVFVGRDPERTIRRRLGWTKYKFKTSRDRNGLCVTFDAIVVGWIYDVPWYIALQVLLNRTDRFKVARLLLM